MVVRVVGEVDLATASVLADALEHARLAAMTMAGLVEIEVDLRAVDFLAAVGLAELVRAQRRCDHVTLRLHVVADQVAVIRPLVLTALDGVLGLRAHPRVP